AHSYIWKCKRINHQQETEDCRNKKLTVTVLKTWKTFLICKIKSKLPVFDSGIIYKQHCNDESDGSKSPDGREIANGVITVVDQYRIGDRVGQCDGRHIKCNTQRIQCKQSRKLCILTGIHSVPG